MDNKKSRNIPFTTLQDINRRSEGRPIILFGGGNIAEKTSRILRGSNLVGIIDNATNMWGEQQNGIEIYSPDILKTKKFQTPFIIITTTSFAEVSYQLESLGFQPESDFYVSPVLNDLRIINELETIEKKMLFTCGAATSDSPEFGGGIYELSVSGDSWSHKKVFSGICYGLIPFGENFISVDEELGIFEIDRKYNIVRSKELPKGMRAHGVDYSEKHQRFVVVGSYIDGVLILDKDFNVIDEIIVSSKQKQTGKAHHHINDCCIVDDSIYMSMFSLTGNWKLDVFDGAVLEYDILSKERVGPVIQNLWMPHNITFIEGSLHVLNSLPGELRTNNAGVVGKFPAFTRGIAHDGVYYYIGQSRNRNYSKNIGVSLNVSIDAGIIVFDSHTKASRFLQLPPKISEIHAIVLLN